MEICTDYERPKITETPQQRAIRKKRFDYRARALLTFLGKPPTPYNVSRIYESEEDPRTLNLGDRQFTVLDVEETYQELEFRVLHRPLRLPAKLLAMFLSSALDRRLDFKVIEIISQSLIDKADPDAIWAINKMVDLDKFIPEHLNELISWAGLENLFPGFKVNQVKFRDVDYTILEPNQGIISCINPQKN